jgi:DNA polymerase-4
VLGLGGDHAPVVDEPWVPRSRSKETTYQHDLTDPDLVRAEVERLATEVTESVVAAGRRVTHVHVKVRTATFFTRIKSSKLPEPTTDPTVVAERALVVLDRFEPARRIRLLGVRVMLEAPG